MPRKKTPHACGCGCGQQTAGGKFMRGHDAKLVGAIIGAVGGTTNLRALVEAQLGRKITSHLEGD